MSSIQMFCIMFLGYFAATRQEDMNTHMFDVIFVVDGSFTIGEENFEIVKQWLVNQTSQIFRVFGEDANVEVLQYSQKYPTPNPDDFRIPFVLGECVNNASCYTPKIMNMSYLSSTTFTYNALKRAMEVEFPNSPSYNVSTKAVVVLTNGGAYDFDHMSSWYGEYKDKMIPFAIGVGPYLYFMDDLRYIANGGESNERVFTVDDFTELHERYVDFVNHVIYTLMDKSNMNTHMFDVIFVVDGSFTIGEENFEIVKQWLVNQTSEIFRVFREDANVEVLQYSHKYPTPNPDEFRISFVLGECVNNASCYTPKIMNMSYFGYSRFTYNALKRAMEVEFPNSPSYDVSIKAVVVLTNGRVHDFDYISSWYGEYKDKVIPFAIGVGSISYFMDDLRYIANGGESNERVFTVDDFTDLHQKYAGRIDLVISALINKWMETITSSTTSAWSTTNSPTTPPTTTSTTTETSTFTAFTTPSTISSASPSTTATSSDKPSTTTTPTTESSTTKSLTSTRSTTIISTATERLAMSTGYEPVPQTEESGLSSSYIPFSVSIPIVILGVMVMVAIGILGWIFI